MHSSGSSSISAIRRCNHTISCAELTSAMYSASAVDKATHVCLLLLHLSAAPLNLKTNPDVDFISSRSPSQSASEYPTRLSLLMGLYNNPWSAVPFKYLNIRLIAFQC